MLNEFLTNPDWLNPQIDCLLWIEHFRSYFGSSLDAFFMSLTRLGEMTIPTLFLCVIYWCFDSMAGAYLFSLNGFCLLFTQFIKMVACVYRPWVLTDRVHPVEAAFKTAGGYSFPSGHSAGVTSTIGGIAYLVRKHKILCTLLVLFVLLVGFSRNYLGVHTPQDVIAGLLIGLICIFAVDWIIKWCEQDKNRYVYLLIHINILIAAMIYYLCTKNYPIDYVNGKLLVNPAKSIYNTFVYFGWVTGLINGVFLCRRFWPFDAKAASKRVRIIRGIIGLILAYVVMHLFVDNIFWAHVNNYAVTFISLFGAGFFLTALYPLMFSNVEKAITNQE